MKLKLFLIILLAFMSSLAGIMSQPVLKPFIGLDYEPNSSDTVCQIPFVTDLSFNSYGYKEGDTIPDFTFYTLNGDAINIRNELSEGMPVLLVSGSYTCPIFRKKSLSINQVALDFETRLKVFIIYIVEAHPIVDLCPYTPPPGEVRVTEENEINNILFRQPKNYGERKSMVNECQNKINIIPEMLIDGPCNDWWLHFGPAPVIAYLIEPNGVIYARHTWFNRYGEYMTRDVKDLLSKTVNFDKATIFEQSTPDNKITGQPDSILQIITTLTNTSNKELFIDVKPVSQQTPMTWMVNYSADCTYPSDMDSLTVYIAPKQKKLFRVFFKTKGPGKGDVTLEFRNSFNAANKIQVQYFAEADTNAGVVLSNDALADGIEIFPLPANSKINIRLNDGIKIKRAELLDIFGNSTEINLPENLDRTFIAVNTEKTAPGLYWLKLTTPKKVILRKILINK